MKWGHFSSAWCAHLGLQAGGTVQDISISLSNNKGLGVQAFLVKTNR